MQADQRPANRMAICQAIEPSGKLLRETRMLLVDA